MLEMTELSWILMFAGLGLVLVEIIVGVDTGFDFVLVGSSLIIGGITGYLANNWVVGLAVTAVLAFSYIIFGRSIIRGKLRTKSYASNADALIGKQARVLSEIVPGEVGSVKVMNDVWRAVSDVKLTVDEEVYVNKVEGITLLVTRTEVSEK